jgi:glycosyltransferase involved in cell wall biosynthesis
MNKNTVNTFKYPLTIVVPIYKLNENKEKLFGWIERAENLPIQIILVHDLIDEDYDIGRYIIEFKAIHSLNLNFIEGMYGCPGFTRNAGLELVRGEWVCFFDCDDLPDINNVYNEVKLCIGSSSSIEVIIGTFLIVNALTKKIDQTYLNKAKIENLKYQPGIWRFIFRYDVIKFYKFSEYRMGEDQLFLALLNLPEMRIRFTSSLFYTYYKGIPDQLTSNLRNIKDLIPVVKLIYQHAKNAKMVDTVRFDIGIVIKLSLSILKSGNIRARFWTLKFLIEIFLLGNFQLKGIFVKEIIRYIRHLILDPNE